MALTVERAEMTNTMRAVWGYATALIAMIVTVMYAYTHLKRLALSPNPVDERGKAMPMINVVDGTAWDIERSANGMIGITQNYLQQLPAVTAERQDQVVARSQMVDVNTRMSRLPKRLVDTQSQTHLLEAPAESVSMETNFLLPSWNIIDGWDGKNGIPYYTTRGLEIIDIERHPHLSVLGGTGTGKSRRFMRPLIACALAAGHRVVIIGKSADYWPFEHHPNATLLKISKITEPGQAALYAKILEAIVAEMNRRDDVLTAAHRSTWTHAGRERTFLILDELGNALRLMDRETSNQCRLLVEGGVMEGRKVGFNFMIANQRATGMASIISQTGKAIFRVEADEEKAHRSLAGASSLRDGYYLARFGTTQIAGAFEPTDAELQKFLSDRPVEKLEEDQWIEGVVSDLPASLPKPDPTPAIARTNESESLYSVVNKMGPKELKVIEMHQAGSSQAEIEREVFGYKGGAASNKVADIIRRYKNATTTENGLNLPNFGAVAG